MTNGPAISVAMLAGPSVAGLLMTALTTALIVGLQHGIWHFLMAL